MFNKSLLLSSGKDITRWEGVIYPYISRESEYDNMGNATGRYFWICSYPGWKWNQGNHTGIFIYNCELSGFYLADTYDDWSVRFLFWDTPPITTLYVKRTDKNITLMVPRASSYSNEFEDDNYGGFFSSSDQGKGIPIIFSGKPL